MSHISCLISFNVYFLRTPKGFRPKSNFVWCIVTIWKHINSELYFGITGNSICKYFTRSANFFWSVTLWFVSSFMVPLPLSPVIRLMTSLIFYNLTEVLLLLQLSSKYNILTLVWNLGKTRSLRRVPAFIMSSQTFDKLWARNSDESIYMNVCQGAVKIHPPTNQQMLG